MQETEVSFASYLSVKDCFHLEKSQLTLQTESKADLLLVVKGFEKQICYLTEISNGNGLKGGFGQ